MKRQIHEFPNNSREAQRQAAERLARMLGTRATVLRREPKAMGRPWSRETSR